MSKIDKRKKPILVNTEGLVVPPEFGNALKKSLKLNHNFIKGSFNKEKEPFVSMFCSHCNKQFKTSLKSYTAAPLGCPVCQSVSDQHELDNRVDQEHGLTKIEDYLHLPVCEMPNTANWQKKNPGKIWYLDLDKNNEYFKFIEKCRLKKYPAGTKLQEHHILARYFFKFADDSAKAYCESAANKILLSKEDHITAHQLLYAVYRQDEDLGALDLLLYNKRTHSIAQRVGVAKSHEVQKVKKTSFWNKETQEAIKKGLNLWKMFQHHDLLEFSFHGQPTVCFQYCTNTTILKKTLNSVHQTNLHSFSTLIEGAKSHGWTLTMRRKKIVKIQATVPRSCAVGEFDIINRMLVNYRMESINIENYYKNNNLKIKDPGILNLLTVPSIQRDQHPKLFKPKKQWFRNFPPRTERLQAWETDRALVFFAPYLQNLKRPYKPYVPDPNPLYKHIYRGLELGVGIYPWFNGYVFLKKEDTIKKKNRVTPVK